MKKYFLLCFIVFFCTPITQAQTAPNILWVKQYGGANTEFPSEMVTDASGNIYITGMFHDETDFEGITLESQKLSTTFVMKTDPLGNIIWAKQFGGGHGVSNLNWITIDNSGYIYTTGIFVGTASFDSFTLNAGSTNLRGIYVIKQDPLGNVLWATQFGNTQNISSFRPMSIVVDTQNNIYTTGIFENSITFGNITLTLSSQEVTENVFIVKQDSSGNVLWAKNFYQTNYVYIEKISVDTSDNIYVIGNFKGTVDFGGVVLTNADQETDIFLAKLDPLGETIWAKQFEITSPTSYDSSIRDFAIDEIGNIYLTGRFHGTLQVGTTAFTSPFHIQNMFVIKTDNLGNPLWGKQFGDNSVIFETTITIDTSNDVYIAGSANNDVWFDSIFLPHCVGNSSCPFVLKINSLGIVEWVEGYGGFTGVANIKDIKNDMNGNLLVLGNFGSVVVFGDIALASYGSTDIFLLKLSEELSIEKNKIGDWNVYPNPTKDFINLDFPDYKETKISIEVLNMLGQKVKTFKNISISESLDLSALTSGIYLLKMNHNGINQTIKIKKQ